MGKYLAHISVVACLCLTSICTSCTSECLENQSSIPLAGFYDMTTKKAITLDSITVFGVGAPGDSLLLNNAKGIKQVYLPLPVVGKSAKFVIHYDQKAISNPLYNDTLSLNYEPLPYFASAECGAMYQYNIKDFTYTRHIVDSIAIPSMKITNADIETINIFFRTNIPEIE